MRREIHGRHLCDCAGKTAHLGPQSPTGCRKRLYRLPFPRPGRSGARRADANGWWAATLPQTRPEENPGKACTREDRFAIRCARRLPAYFRSIAQFPVSNVRPINSIPGEWRPTWQFRMPRSQPRAQLCWHVPFRLFLTRRNLAPRSRVIFLQEKRKNEHDGAERGQDPKDIHIRQGPALLMYQLVEPRNRLVAGISRP